jgi:ArsR family transcriptional regulator
VHHGLIYRKPKYHLLSAILPTFCLRRKVRRGYLARVADELARGRFLDIGCGVGVAALLYGRLHRGRSVGADLSGERLEWARREARRHRSAARFVRARAERLPFPRSSFDTVYLGQILEHLDAVEAALDEADRVLTPAGRLVISVPDRDLVPSPAHVRVFDAEALRALFEERGYTDFTLHPYDDRRLVGSGTMGPAVVD